MDCARPRRPRFVAAAPPVVAAAGAAAADPRRPFRPGRAPTVAPAADAARALAARAAAALLRRVLGLDDARLRRAARGSAQPHGDLSARLASAEQDLARRDLRARVLESDDVRVLSLGGKDPQPGRARPGLLERRRRSAASSLAGNLTPLPAGKQYELWVFEKGKPVPAGVFDADPSGRALFESPDLSAIDQAQNFAVTVEPRGGVPAPTGPIVLVGTPS